MKTEIENPKREPVEVVAIVPARGGQQSIPYKNLQLLGDKSLVAWAVEVAFDSKEVEAVVVSTEDDKIAEEARHHGALVAPRPVEYAQSTSGDAGFYHHAVKWMSEEHGWQPELLINLRPTGPLRFPRDVDAMVRYMKDHEDVDGLKSVIPTPLHPHKMWHMDGNGEIGTAGKLTPVFDSEFHQTHGPDQPRQVLQEKFPVYFQDAQIDITRRKFVLRPETLERDNVWGDNLHGYVLDARTSADLDTPEDFHRAEKIYTEMLAEGRNDAS